MATQIRSKPATKAPVTRHPLFPAMVALWFGALFGLGSLAVRASLIESVVLNLGLDVLLPAAAPPLGLKLRLILALLMAAIGIGLGAMLGRRIARPKEVVAPRRRGVSARKARVAVSEAIPADSPMSRRRPLTSGADEAPQNHYEVAPLPGGAPAILDVTQFDLAPAVDAAQDQEEAPLALDTFTLAEDGPGDVRAAELSMPEPTVAEPLAESVSTFAPEAHSAQQSFRVPEASTEVARQTFHAPDPGQQAFRMPDPAAEPQMVEEVLPSAPASNFHRPFAAPLTSEVAPPELEMEQEVEADIAFTPDQDLDKTPVAAQAVTEPESADYMRMIEALRGEEPVAAMAAEPEHAPPAVETAPLPQLPSTITLAPLALPEMTPEIRSRIETAPLAELSPVELIERLALAMRQRESKVPLPAALVDAFTTLTTPARPEVAETAPDVAYDLAVEAAVQDSVDDALNIEPEFAPDVELGTAVVDDLPLALELPAAMRPIDFGDHDDVPEIALPPRSFTAPAAPIVAEVSDEPDDADDVVPEDSYSSLLNLARPVSARQEFVRIDEPEADGPEIEPVVIFPGHGARPGLRFAAPDPSIAEVPVAAEPQAAAHVDGLQLRRFDAPATTAAPAATSQASGIRQDPEEAQRALRSALATLQRMSGAA